MTFRELQTRLQAAGITLAASGGKLSVSPAGSLTDTLRAGIREHKDDLMEVAEAEQLEQYRREWAAIQPLYAGWAARMEWLTQMGGGGE